MIDSDDRGHGRQRARKILFKCTVFCFAGKLLSVEWLRRGTGSAAALAFGLGRTAPRQRAMPRCIQHGQARQSAHGSAVVTPQMSQAFDSTRKKLRDGLRQTDFC